MKTLLNKWFITGCLVWVVIYSTRKAGYPVPFFNGYIDDFFAIPVIANLGLWFKRTVIIKNNYYVLSAWQTTFIVVYVSLTFEALLPAVSKAYTADLLDVLLYIAGGIFFYQVMNKPAGADYKIKKQASF